MRTNARHRFRNEQRNIEMKNKLKIIRRKENEKHTNGNEINRIKRISSKNSVSKRKKNCKLINTSHEATADPVRHFFRGFFFF